MATEEFIKRSIIAGKQYEALPDRIKASVSLGDWKYRVKEHCIQRGMGWSDSLAKSATTEAEYYEGLLAFYQSSLRIFPYHLSDYICRVMRTTPFRYSCGILYAVMREEKSYDRIPNFTAADILRLTGIGRNEYISIMNKCKAKKLLWRVNRAIAKEMLPTEPLDIEMQPWWTVNVVNLGETEFRQLNPEELAICQDACKPGGLRVHAVGTAALQQLYKRELIYLDVTIKPTDHVSIPPLEGFVSNKDSELGEDKGDPLEAVLYAVFVATSSRASVSELAVMLSVDQSRLLAAVSVACRLGFAIRLPTQGDDVMSQGSGDTTARDLDLDSDPGEVSRPASAAKVAAPSLEAAAGETQSREERGIALVVDAEVTSCLMMGALSPGLKRHSVTLFEGGRVSGAEVIAELITELHASVQQAQQFEGEMQMLAEYAGSLAAALECVREAGGSQSIELLRKESLAGLTPAAASRVLSHAYSAVVPITPLPSPPLPLAPSRPGPTSYGASVEASTPWLQLALYRASRSGPASLVLLCGQRFKRLPSQLAASSHCLLWPWDANSVRAQSVPVIVEATFLLSSLNEYLRRTALVVQPVILPRDGSQGPGERNTSAPITAHTYSWGYPGSPLFPAAVVDLQLLDVPLPLSPGAAAERVTCYRSLAGEAVSIQLPQTVAEAIPALGLTHAVGRLRMMQVAREESGAASPGEWTPLTVQLGLPLQPAALCSAVCKEAKEAQFLQPGSRKQHAQGQALLQQRLFALISEFGACSNCLAPTANKPEEPLGYVDLPIHNLLVTHGEIQHLDLGCYLQGLGALYVE